jgi:hypothetical protein
MRAIARERELVGHEDHTDTHQFGRNAGRIDAISCIHVIVDGISPWTGMGIPSRTNHYKIGAVLRQLFGRPT